jgi:uncharacterized phiE125 gp8 family phage protein
MQIQITSSSFSEPVTIAQVKSYMGYPLTDASQDTIIQTMISGAREFIEQRTALSLVVKSYKVYFELDDDDDGWYELPVSPVSSTPAIVVKMNGAVTTYEQKGMNIISIRPDAVSGTILIGATSTPSYLEVEFDAGQTSYTANQLLLDLVNWNFNNRDGVSGFNIASLPYDMVQRLRSISMNI